MSEQAQLSTIAKSVTLKVLPGAKDPLLEAYSKAHFK